MINISEKEFESYRIPRMLSKATQPWEEIEFYKKGTYIGAITKDKIDHDFGFVVFKVTTREAEFIKVNSSIDSKSKAINKLSIALNM